MDETLSSLKRKHKSEEAEDEDDKEQGDPKGARSKGPASSSA